MNELFAKKFAESLPQIAQTAVAIRHDLHQHPEIGYEEVYTSSVVKRELGRLNIPFTDKLAGGTGVVGLIKGGKDGPCVALRADMDALPIEEQTGLPYRSLNPGKMHACGHDGHTSILIGTAAILKEFASELHGNVKLIFQPAEEGALGGQRMAQDGVLGKTGGPPVQSIFGLHGWPGFKVGTAGTRAGPLLASVDGFNIRVGGIGTHAAAPHNGVDPIVAASAIVQALQTVVSRELDPLDSAVVTVAQFHAGSTFNVIPQVAELCGTVRALLPDRRKQVLAAVERITRTVAEAYRCSVAIEWFGTTPSTINTLAEAEYVQKTIAANLGQPNAVDVTRPAMWGEDFAFYLEQIPGCFYLLGLQPMDRNSYPMLHNPQFDFTDAAVAHGIRLMAQIAAGKLS